MQENLRQWVIMQLRTGVTTAELRGMLQAVLAELNTVEQYIKAVAEADFRP